MQRSTRARPLETDQRHIANGNAPFLVQGTFYKEPSPPQKRPSACFANLPFTSVTPYAASPVPKMPLMRSHSGLVTSGSAGRRRPRCACCCMRRDPDASRRRSLRASPRAPGLRTVRLGGGGVSGSGRDEGACARSPRRQGMRRKGECGFGGELLFAPLSVASSHSIAPSTSASLRVACSAPAISSWATVTAWASATPAAPTQLRRRTCGLPPRHTRRLPLALVLAVSGPLLPLLPPLGLHATWIRPGPRTQERAASKGGARVQCTGHKSQ